MITSHQIINIFMWNQNR